MIKVEFRGLRDRLQTLDRLEREQLPFAAALALTRTAQAVSAELRNEMAAAFDRPTRATLNSLFIEPATKERISARVWINDGESSTGKGWGAGRAAVRWLSPQVYGTGRQHKGFERMLQRRGVLASDQYVIPGEGAPLDQHGNIKRGVLTKILSGARLWDETGYSANRTSSARSLAKGNRRYFVLREGSRPVGIAERTRYGPKSRNSIRMVLVFAKRPTYRKRFDFFGVGDKAASDSLPVEFEKALTQAVATRRR